MVDGFISGLHRAPFLGLSVDFAEHRQYMPGDDIRRIDWRLYARSDRFYLKHYEADSNANFMVILDTSRSMSFRQDGISKLDYGRYLAACLSYFSRQQRDRVGLVTIAGEIVDYVPPAAGHLDIVLHTIDRIEAGGSGTLAEPLYQLTGRLRRRGIMVVISDLYEEPDAVVDAVKDLRYAGQDVIVFHLLDPAELDFPFEKPASFQDLETSDQSSRGARPSAGGVSRAHPRPHGDAVAPVRGAPHRLCAVQHRHAPRLRALPVPVRAPEADPGTMSALAFLAPLFLLGLGFLIWPVLVHLVQKDRREVVEFPSLMFLERVPYKSTRRQKIRHWLLLLMRLAALAALIAAFARPFFDRDDIALAAGPVAGEVVILLDRSYSMGYGDRWADALAGARQAVGQLGPEDRGSLIFFSGGATLAVRSTTDRTQLFAALDTAQASDGRDPLRPGARSCAHRAGAVPPPAQARRGHLRLSARGVGRR